MSQQAFSKSGDVYYLVADNTQSNGKAQLYISSKIMFLVRLMYHHRPSR